MIENCITSNIEIPRIILGENVKKIIKIFIKNCGVTWISPVHSYFFSQFN